MAIDYQAKLEIYQQRLDKARKQKENLIRKLNKAKLLINKYTKKVERYRCYVRFAERNGIK